MIKIVFYQDGNGNQPVRDYLFELQSKNNKYSRIKLNKIQDYLSVLTQHGTATGIPYVNHISGDIWELRLLRDKFFFFCLKGDY